MAIQAWPGGAIHDHDACEASPVLDADKDGVGPSSPVARHLAWPLRPSSVGSPASLIGPAVAGPSPVPEEARTTSEVESKAGDGPDKAPKTAATRETRQVIPGALPSRRPPSGVAVKDAAMDPSATDVEDVVAPTTDRGPTPHRGIPSVARQAPTRAEGAPSTREITPVAVTSEAIHGEVTAPELLMEPSNPRPMSPGAPA